MEAGEKGERAAEIKSKPAMTSNPLVMSHPKNMEHMSDSIRTQSQMLRKVYKASIKNGVAK